MTEWHDDVLYTYMQPRMTEWHDDGYFVWGGGEITKENLYEQL